MAEQTPAPKDAPGAPAPQSPEAQQLSQWMADYGRPALIGLAIAVVALLGMSIWRNHQAARKSDAVQALFQARSPEELQQMAVVDPKASTAPPVG